MAHALYERWLQLLETCPDQWALTDGATGRTWTFADLHREAESVAQACSAEVRVVSGHDLTFITETLAAWHADAVLVPSEQLLSDDAFPDPFSRSTSHVKRTSGSTGASRWIAFQPEQLLADVENIVATMGLRAEWPNVGVISLAHSYGFSNLVLPLLVHGIPLILLPNPLPATLGQCLANHAEVTLPAVPAMWRAWSRARVLSDSVKLAISAGAPLSIDLEIEVFERFGIKIHNFYGSSECGGIAYDRSNRPRKLADEVGTAMAGVTLEISPCNRMEVASRAVAEGYLDSRPEDRLGEGRFLTQDKAMIDAAGVVTLLGRTGESINVAGRKVSPQVVEDVLLAQSGVKHAVVFGITSKDAERVEEIVAVVATDPGVDLATLRMCLREGLSTWQQPRHWWCCEDLRPDRRGKISRAFWRNAYLEQRNH